MTDIPPELVSLLDAWIDRLRAANVPIHGVYLYGSIALDAWSPGPSDIDAVVVTNGPLPPATAERLGQLHGDLMESFPLAHRLEAMYIPRAFVGEAASDIPPYPVFQEGRFRAEGRGDVNAVTWWLLKHRGIALAGEPIAPLLPGVTWRDVREAMTYNLDAYWRKQAELPGGARFLDDVWVEFAVSTLCRIMITLQDGEIVPKEAAIQRCQSRLPARWRPLLAEGLRLRTAPAAAPVFRSRVTRMRETRAFIAWARSRGWQNAL